MRQCMCWKKKVSPQHSAFLGLQSTFYSAMRKHGGIRHILARHVEGASHMAEGYTRAAAGNIGVCLGTSGPAGTDMITALYSASADSIPILCITGQAPRARLHKEDFQAVDIEAIAKPVSKMAVTVREAALVPRVLQQAFHLMRSGRPGPVLVDLPFDVQVAEIEFDPDMYEPLPVYKPAASRVQIEKALHVYISGASNAAVIEQIRRARPHWLDVKPASSLISVLNQGKTLLHAGPPMRWQEMTGPMKGACIGACLFEGWAKDEMSALALLEQGKVNFIPCHHVNAVGPMGGITSASMPMLVVENITDGNRAYCNLNEGIGKVMRFGAYGEDVQQRLRWMRDVLMPVLSAALGRLERGLDLTAMMAQGITMGDEFHQRNIASSALLMRTLAPHIARLEHDKQQIAEVMDFLSVTDQFFLNLAMAYCKAAMDAGAQIRAGSIVTAMTRNGDMFGIRVSGLGDRWFTAPVNTPQGLFFTGFSQDQANPDMGDSAITETFGIGGAAMIAAPGVTRFVGAGGMEAAKSVSEEMAEIYLERNMQLQIPGWDFQGACLGLDIRRVVETGITPLINTGIAHKEAGIGQIGAGTVRAPLACFEQALEALAESMGVS